MDWLLVVTILGWPVAWYLGFRSRPTVALPAPEGAEDGRWRVVAVARSGARARQMYERATPGDGETVAVYDGITCRGQKGSTEG